MDRRMVVAIGACTAVLLHSPAYARPAILDLLAATDVSGSVNDAEFARVRDVIGRQLPLIVREIQPKRVGILAWSDAQSCWLSPSPLVSVPERVIVDCQPVRKSEAEALIKHLGRKKTGAHQDECRRRQEEADRIYDSGVSSALKPVTDKLESLDQGKPLKTYLGEILRRCSADRQTTLVLVVTDGVSDPPFEPIPPLAEGARTIILLLPSKEDAENIGAALAARRKRLLTVAPWATVIFGFNVTDDPASWLLPLLDVRNAR